MNGLLPVNVQRRAGSAGTPALVLGPGPAPPVGAGRAGWGPGRASPLQAPQPPLALGPAGVRSHEGASLRPPHLGRGCRKASSALLTLLEPKAGGNGVCGTRLAETLLALFWLLGGAVEDF